MESFLSSAQEATSLAAVDFDSLRLAISSASTLDATRALLEALIDAFSARSDLIYQRAVLTALAELLQHPTPPTSSLSPDDFILLSLFFGELSTLEEAALFAPLAFAMGRLFVLTAPLAVGVGGGEAVESLRRELQTLRLAVCSRLGPSQPNATAVQLAALDCLAPVARVWFGGDGNGVALGQQLLEAVWLPLNAAVEGLRPSGGRLGGVSPLVVAAVLGLVEELLGVGAAHAYCLPRLLSVLQKCLSLQQQPTPAFHTQRGGEGADVWRLASVQRAVRRTLSAALRCLPATHETHRNDERNETHSSDWRTAVLAALAAFGGRPEAMAPHMIPPQPISCVGWEQTARMRVCASLLPLSTHAADAEGDAGRDVGDLEDLRGGGAALLASSAGSFSAAALVEMVMLSIRHMQRGEAGGMDAIHLRGLEQMQQSAARRAQREEVMRLRRIEQQGVEGIPPGRLLEHLKESAAVYAHGAQLLESDTARAAMSRAGFLALLDAYDALRGEAEALVREAQGLIARALAQLPPEMMDVALDAICLRLRRELTRHGGQRHSSNSQPTPGAAQSAVATHAITGKGQTSAAGDGGGDRMQYDLVLQVLFTLFSAQAPTPHIPTAAAFASGGRHHLLGTNDGRTELSSRSHFTIDTDAPLAWLHADGSDTTDRKRSRVETTSSSTAVPTQGGTDAGEEDSGGALCFYRDDSAMVSSAYSHFLCRVMELCAGAERPALLLDVLLQAPRLTRHVWHFIHRNYCQSGERARCLLGAWLLKSLALRRPVCRRYAVNSLLHLATNAAEAPRRLAVAQLGALLATTHPRIMSAEVEGLLVRYARVQLAAIPATRPKLLEESDGIRGGGEKGAVHATSVSERARLADALDRRLGPFLMLCARRPRELFPTLLTVAKECAERGNGVMLRLLAAHVDVRRMCQRLFRTDALSFMSNVVPFLRRHSSDAALLVQHILWALSRELREMAQAAGNANDAPSAQSQSAEDVGRAAAALLGQARVMYESSGASHDGVCDVRFIAPFLSLIPAEDLRRTYLRSFLRLLQSQLQRPPPSQSSQTPMHRLEDAFGLQMDHAELQGFVREVVREVLVRSPVRLPENHNNTINNNNNNTPSAASHVSRGLSRVELLVFLHRAPHETAADTPISPVTTKEVIRVLFELTRSFDETSAELLYGPEEIKQAVRHMMQGSAGVAASVPSQLMATLILACSMQSQRIQTDLVRFVHQAVLLPLAKDAAWDKNVQLWRGVLLFAEMYYRECSTFLVNLPDQVLINALRASSKLCECFKEEHGNNASFGHVLSSL